MDHQYQKRALAYLEAPNQLFLTYTVILKIFNLILIMEKILYCLKRNDNGRSRLRLFIAG